jgi:L-lactate utilization protein LutC
MIHKVKALSPDQKQLIEGLVGRRVLEDEAISVRAFPAPLISDETREEIVTKLKEYFAEVDANRKSVSPKEADEIITEAIRSTRPGYRPHR